MNLVLVPCNDSLTSSCAYNMEIQFKRIGSDDHTTRTKTSYPAVLFKITKWIDSG
jgi:hypothetical protein